MIEAHIRRKFEEDDQIIIFVDQRVVADMLFKVLKDVYKTKDHHKIDVVYSHGGSSLFKKIFKKTNVDLEQIVDLFDEVLNLKNSYRRTLTAQKKTIDNFRSGECKILIATAVIEEGLDIPSCNKIIVYDKIQTPKSFIQMSGRARQIDSTISFMCLNTEIDEIKTNIEAMESYKDLLQANENLIKIIPDVRHRSCTYKPEEIFIIEDTGARVSIDGSMDCLNMVLQKLTKRCKMGKLKEMFESDAKTYFKCLLTVKIKGEEVAISNADPYSTKVKARAHAALMLIKKLYDMGFLDEYLSPAYEVQNRDRKAIKEAGFKQRQEEMAKQKRFKEENKAKCNREEIIDVKFEYQLTHTKLTKFGTGDRGGFEAKVLIMVPKSQKGTYPFVDMRNLK